MGKTISRVGFAAALAALCLASVPQAGGAPRAAKAGPLYKDASAPIPARVEDLLKRMTLQEKIAQMLCVWGDKVQIFDANLQFDESKAKAKFPDGVGQLARPQDRKGAYSPRIAPPRGEKETN